MVFYNLLLFSKYSGELDKKEKDKIVFKITHNQARDVIGQFQRFEDILCVVTKFSGKTRLS
jgi:hypothetical protein